ncbi:DUF742 domain-containing protein [Dactylosporangium sp. NBC_01737]|jgi:hypothetical protein|uniref:DUF742 domain-containing protein n=1 Tax=Dactylosporangium sp. NBC_01737 TaxID=2975959 RepID=UPI002E149BE2|nr:DUF742 domain-containing protein [Dactylosporangium sp. NBC_01737]
MRHTDGPAWADDEAGPFVRPYAMTQGRTRPAEGDFDLIAVVVATQPAGSARKDDLQPEQTAILSLCQRPLSVAEVSAHLHLPLGTVRVLLGDLLGAGLILTSGPRPSAQPQQQRQHLLKAVINGLHSL